MSGDLLPAEISGLAGAVLCPLRRVNPIVPSNSGDVRDPSRVREPSASNRLPFRFGASPRTTVDFNTGEDQLSFARDAGVGTARVADHDCDGTSDLLLTSNGGGPVTLYRVSSLSGLNLSDTPAIGEPGRDGPGNLSHRWQWPRQLN